MIDRGPIWTIVWHYAVWKISRPFLYAACDPTINPDDGFREHGITVVRGDVNCPDCLRMMGPT